MKFCEGVAFTENLEKECSLMERILIVEDDDSLNQGLCRALRGEGRELLPCCNLRTARQRLSQASLILLDVNLPDGSGLDFLREVKEILPEIPVILLTANDTDLDIVDGLEQGADDYITKPFSLSVLRARVNTQLRKRGKTRDLVFRGDGFLFDFPNLRFFNGDQEVQLSKTEQKLLRLLVENRGNVMHRELLVDRIWTDGADFVEENALSVTVKRLRDKLGAQAYIKTVYGTGYMWVKQDE